MKEHTIIGTNVLTVLLSKTDEINKLKAFFCPYTQSITSTYQGEIKAILPGYNPEETPQVMIQPQRMKYHMNIHYSFRETADTGNTINFWIQDAYFEETPIRTYFCCICQFPQLYFSKNKVVFYENKADVSKGQEYTCGNPHCKESYTYLGIVQITDVNSIVYNNNHG